MSKTKKDSKYTFNLNYEDKEKFKIYCKMMKVSPSDLLIEVVESFNRSVDEIVKMKNIDELQLMVQGQYELVQSEIDKIAKHPTFKK